MFTITKNHKAKTVVVYNGAVDESYTPDDTSFYDITDEQSLKRSGLTTNDMLGLFNSAVGDDHKLVKFQDKKSAAARTLPVLDKIAVDFGAKPAPKKASPKAPKTTRKPRGIELPMLDRVLPVRKGTKQEALINALRGGATMPELIKAVSSDVAGKKDWQPSTVRSALYWDVNKVKGYGITTDLTGDEPVYTLIEPTE